MNRKEFLKVTSTFLLCSGVCAALPQSGMTEGPDDAKIITEEMKQKRAFTHAWIKSMMETIDTSLDEKGRIALMENSGRECAKRGALKAAQSANGDLDKFLDTLRSWIGTENIRMNKRGIEVIYSKCFCPLVEDMKAPLSQTYCNCSKGWLLEMFGTVLGRTPAIEIKETIKRGGNQCRFLII